MAKSNAKNRNRAPAAQPKREPTPPPFPECVIIGANRANDVGPYCTALYNADKKRWTNILPWEFPQNASRQEEEAFIDDCFTKHEVHMQGGTTHEGAGYRFLKQVWWTIALYNYETCVPQVARWWWENEENQDLIEDPCMLKWMCADNAIPMHFFKPEDLEHYGEKILWWAMRDIQHRAHAKREEFLAAEADSTKSQTDKKSDAAAIELSSTQVSSLTAEASSSKNHADEKSDAATIRASNSEVSPITAEASSTKHEADEKSDAATIELSSTQVSSFTAAPISANSAAATNEPSSTQVSSLNVEPPVDLHELGKKPIDEVASAEPVNDGLSTEPVNDAVPAESANPPADSPLNTKESANSGAIDEQAPMEKIKPSVQAEAAIASDSQAVNTKPDSSTDHKRNASSANKTISSESPTDHKRNVSLAEKTISTAITTDSSASVAENKSTSHTPLRANNADFVPRIPLDGSPVPKQFESLIEHNMSDQHHNQEQNTFATTSGGHSGYNDYGGHRGGRGGRRGSRGETTRRMSRGGYDNYSRGRLGSNTFENAQGTIDNFQPQLPQIHGNRAHVPPMIQPGRGGYQHYAAESFQRQGPRAVSNPDPALGRQTQHGQRPYVPPIVTQPQSKQHATGSSMSRIGNNPSSADENPDEVTKNYIGSNRTEVTQLVLFHLPLDCIVEDIERMFSNVGLAGASIDLRPINPQIGFRQYSLMAFARFETHDQARHGLVLHGSKMGENTIVVEVSKEFWDPTCARYRCRYGLLSQATSVNMQAMQRFSAPQSEGTWTPRTHQFESSHDGGAASGPTQGRRVSHSNNGQTRHFSNSEQSKARILPTQDARFMGPVAPGGAVAADTTLSTEPDKEEGSKKQRNNKNKKKQGTSPVDGGPAKAFRDKTNQSSEPPSQAGESAQHKKPHDAKAVKHIVKQNTKESELGEPAQAQDAIQVADKATDTSPKAGVEQSLKVNKRAADVAESSAPRQNQPKTVQQAAPVHDKPKAAPEKDQPKKDSKATPENEQVKTIDKAAPGTGVAANVSHASRVHASDEIKSIPATSAAAVTIATDAVEPVAGKKYNEVLTTAADVGQHEKDKPQTTTVAPQKVPVSLKEQTTRVVTPIRVQSSKLGTTDDTVPSPTHVRSKKPPELLPSAREVSESSMPPTPTSAYNTAPVTPAMGTSEFKAPEKSQDKASEKIPEKPKGPSQTESLSMFGKKQAKPKKKNQKGKDTLKGKPKELAKINEKEDTDGAANENDGVASASTSAMPKTTSDSEHKAVEAVAPGVAGINDTLKQESITRPTESPVTSPSKRKLGTFSSLFGLLGRSNPTTAPSQESSDHHGKPASDDKPVDKHNDVPNTKTGPTVKDRKSTDGIDEQQASVSIDPAKPDVQIAPHDEEHIDKLDSEAFNKPSESIGQTLPTVLKPSTGEAIHTLQPMTEDSPEVIGLGLTHVPPLSEHDVTAKKKKRKSKGKQRVTSVNSVSDGQDNDTALSSGNMPELSTFNTPTKPTYERDKGEDAHSDSSHTLSAHSAATPFSDTPSSKPFSHLPQQDHHLIEAPLARNANRRRKQAGNKNVSVLSSESLISACEANSSEDRQAQTLKIYQIDSAAEGLGPAEGQTGVVHTAPTGQTNILYILIPPIDPTGTIYEWSCQQPSTDSDTTPAPFSAQAAASEQAAAIIPSPTTQQLTDIMHIESSEPTSTKETPNEEHGKKVIEDSDDSNGDLEELGPDSD